MSRKTQRHVVYALASLAEVHHTTARRALERGINSIRGESRRRRLRVAARTLEIKVRP